MSSPFQKHGITSGHAMQGMPLAINRKWKLTEFPGNHRKPRELDSKSSSARSAGSNSGQGHHPVFALPVLAERDPRFSARVPPHGGTGPAGPQGDISDGNPPRSEPKPETSREDHHPRSRHRCRSRHLGSGRWLWPQLRLQQLRLQQLLVQLLSSDLPDLQYYTPSYSYGYSYGY